MKNREVYNEDPQTNTLLNQGVAKVNTPEADPEGQGDCVTMTLMAKDGQAGFDLDSEPGNRLCERRSRP
jgi:hypothetical protein